VVLDGGEQVATTTVVWAAGITVSGTIAEGIGDSATRNGRLAVDGDLRVKGRENVWAIGDAAAVPRGHGEELSPQLAPVAIQSGRHCARQILRASQGQSTEPFSYLDKGIMATIGRNAAVACVPHVPVITGVAGWLAWLGLHLVYLIGFRNRLRVLINWAWRYFDWPSGPRLIVADAETCDDEPDAP
jgi:NADH dehydrogenase